VVADADQPFSTLHRSEAAHNSSRRVVVEHDVGLGLHRKKVSKHRAQSRNGARTRYPWSSNMAVHRSAEAGIFSRTDP
jgi:hypothetical protein